MRFTSAWLVLVGGGGLRGAQAAGVALCYGNNNGGACVAGSVHPLAPNVAQRAHPGFSAARPGSPINPPFCSLPRPPSLQLHFYFPLVFDFSPSLPTFCVCSRASCLFPSSQFHPFFRPTMTAFHWWHLESNKTFSENAKPAQKCHRSRDFCLKSRSNSPRQSCFVFLAH